MPSHAPRFERCTISINRLRNRKSDFAPREWLLDSGGFTEITTYGAYRLNADAYASLIMRWSRCGRLRGAVSQDYMCEPVALARTGRSVRYHQRETIRRYRRIGASLSRLHAQSRRGKAPPYLMPVLQGTTPAEYLAHLKAYGALLGRRAWVGIGSICRRNGRPQEVEEILRCLSRVRPDLRYHGFGLKLTAFALPAVRRMLYSSDSLAWSLAARRSGRSANDPKEAEAYLARVESLLAAQVRS